MIEKQTFRDAMARLAAAVSVITSDGPGGLCGCTASAVCSVSDTPPILLVCINRASRNNAILKMNQRLCVNVLRADQQPLAEQFSRSGSEVDDRFAGGAWLRGHPDATSEGQLHLPVLAGALVSLECEISGMAEVGSHTVFYCTVETARFGTAGAALTYFGRAFGSLASGLTAG